jgi:hypothetical protein
MQHQIGRPTSSPTIIFEPAGLSDQLTAAPYPTAPGVLSGRDIG